MNEQHDARVRTLAESTFSLSGDTVQAPKREQAQPDYLLPDLKSILTML